MPRYRTAAQLGLMEGTPPPVERLVTLANWQDPPFSRWGFQHVRDLIPTARISRGSGPPWRLPRAERDFDDLTFRSGRRTLTLARMLADTATDGYLVLHRGRIVMERYRFLKSIRLPSTPSGIFSRRGNYPRSPFIRMIFASPCRHNF